METGNNIISSPSYLVELHVFSNSLKNASQNQISLKC